MELSLSALTAATWPPRVYVIAVEELIALARDRLTRGLSRDECQRYLHLDNCPQQEQD